MIHLHIGTKPCPQGLARWSGRVARTDGTSAFSIAIGALAAVAEKRKNNVHDPFGKLLAGADAVIVFLMG
jgi:hypothetical protein